MKIKVYILDADKLVPVPVVLSKLSDVGKNNVTKKDAYNAKIKTIEDKMLDITNVATNASLNAQIKVKGEIHNITNLANAIALTAAENKIPNVSNLFKKIDYNTKTIEIENRTTDRDHNKFFLLQNLIS